MVTKKKKKKGEKIVCSERFSPRHVRINGNNRRR